MTQVVATAAGAANAIEATAVDGNGVYATSTNGTGIYGVAQAGIGVYGQGGDGVVGETSGSNGNGVAGSQTSSTAAPGFGYTGNGVLGLSASPLTAGVYARNTASSGASSAPSGGSVPSCCGLAAYSDGTAIFGQGSPAGYFEGNVLVTGDVILVNTSATAKQGGDIAEDFDAEPESDAIEPGTVVIISPAGRLCASAQAYDTRVAGIVSGAGDLRPAVVLKRTESSATVSVALVGTAFCKVDAAFGNIEAGDLLTTSTTSGHAMKATDRPRAIGAVLGKALAAFGEGRGMIPVLVGLR
jgi:hypothetical protein